MMPHQDPFPEHSIDTAKLKIASEPFKYHDAYHCDTVAYPDGVLFSLRGAEAEQAQVKQRSSAPLSV